MIEIDKTDHEVKYFINKTEFNCKTAEEIHGLATKKLPDKEEKFNYNIA